MNRTETQRIAEQLNFAYAGPAWHGPSIMDILNKVDAVKAGNKLPNSHSIATIVFHMTAWRNFAIKQLQGYKQYDVSDAENFQSFQDLTEAKWNQLKGDLLASQNTLLGLLEKTEDPQLLDIVGNRKYDFYVLLHGIIQHDLYHLGQIVLLSK